MLRGMYIYQTGIDKLVHLLDVGLSRPSSVYLTHFLPFQHTCMHTHTIKGYKLWWLRKYSI